MARYIIDIPDGTGSGSPLGAALGTIAIGGLFVGLAIHTARETASQNPAANPEEFLKQQTLSETQQKSLSDVEETMNRVDAINQGESVDPAPSQKEIEVAHLFEESESENRPVVWPLNGQSIATRCTEIGTAFRCQYLNSPGQFVVGRVPQMRRIRYANAEAEWDKTHSQDLDQGR